MIRITWLAATLSICGSTFGQGDIAVPWPEVRDLLTASVEREMRDELAPSAKKAQICAIEAARFQVTAGDERVHGEVTVTGRIIEGDPAPVPLLGSDFIISELKHVEGGAVYLAENGGGLLFMPAAGLPQFEVNVAFLLNAVEESGTREAAFETPPAIANTMSLALPQGAQLLSLPGVRDSGGLYHLPAAQRVSITYADTGTTPAAASIEVDSVSRISVQERRVCITTYFLPVRPVAAPLLVRGPDGAEVLSSDLSASRIKPSNGAYEVSLPVAQSNPFAIEFGIPVPGESGEVSFKLPVIEGNVGQQGRFALEEPEGTLVSATAPALVAQIPVARLGAALAENFANIRHFSSINPDTPIALSVKRFSMISAPPTVLESQEFFAAIEENGDILSVLSLDIPPEFGTRLALKAVENGRIWSIAVNDARKEVYEGDAGTWIIPLDGHETSRVRLAFLRSGPKLGLQGTLDVIVPETGLVSQKVHIGVALPERIELLSVEGPVNNDSGEGRMFPPELVGHPHYFSRSFYRGEGMTLSLSYREPIKPTAN